LAVVQLAVLFLIRAQPTKFRWNAVLADAIAVGNLNYLCRDFAQFELLLWIVKQANKTTPSVMIINAIRDCPET
jgi:hypothetical protein